MKKYLLSLVVYTFTSLSHPCLLHGIKLGHYQQIVIKGETICSSYSGQECQPRCDAIEKIIRQYKRPVTVLDIGAAEGYFAFKLAPKFPDSVFVMVESDPRNNLLKLCELNDLPNVIYLRKNIDLEDLRKLSECEHFDIVICMNIIHHFGKDNWKLALEHTLNLGEKLIIETPPADAPHTRYWEDIDQELQKICTKKVCTLPRWSHKSLLSHTYLVERKKDHLKTTFFGHIPAKRKYTIVSDYNQKYLEKTIRNNLVRSEYKPGINLYTFKKLEGAYPFKNDIVNGCLNLAGIKHTDAATYNFIIAGKKIVPIDTDEDRKTSFGCTPNYMQTLANNITNNMIRLTKEYK